MVYSQACLADRVMVSLMTASVNRSEKKLVEQRDQTALEVGSRAA